MNAQPPLFRHVPSSVAPSDIGVPVGITSIWSRFYSLMVGLVFSAVFALVCFGTYSRRVEVVGFLVPDRGLIKIVSPRPGHVIRQFVSEGDHVANGDPLLAVDVSDDSDSGHTADLVAKNLKDRRAMLLEQLANLRTVQDADGRSLDANIKSVSDQLVALQAQVDAESQYVQIAVRLFDRSQQLHERSVNSASAADEAEENAADAKAKVASLLVALNSLRGSLDQLHVQKEGLAAKQSNDRQQIEQAVSELDQQIVQNEDQGMVILRAPQPGTATRLTVRLGSFVDTTSPLLTVVPQNSRLEADLYAPSSAAGLIKPGQLVKLQYDAYPYEKFGLQEATISSISQTSVLPTELPFPVTSQEPVYVITAKLQKTTITAYGRQEPLSPGSKFQADVVLESRRIWQWIFEPIIAAKAQL